MRTVGTLEAKNSLSALLDSVEGGEEIVITRHGKAVARLVREPGDADGRERAREAAKSLAIVSRHLTLGGLDLRDLIDEGRL